MLQVSVGEVSDRPYPSGDAAAGQLLPLLGHRALHGHAAAVGNLQLGEIDLAEIGMVQQPVVERVDRREAVDLVFHQFLDEAGHVARIGDQKIDAAGAHRQQEARRQREDVIERQRANDEDLVDMRRQRQRRLQPGIVLQHVGEYVAVKQRCALGDAGGAAGILQEGDVVGPDLRLAEFHAAAGRDGVVEQDRARNRKRRHHLLHAPHHQIDDHALEAEHVPHAADDDMLDRGLRQHLLHGVREVFEHDNGFGAGILELVFQLARSVERVDVHHRIARAQHGRGGHRILQHVRHHQRDARALLETLALQIGGKRHRHLVEIAVGDRLVHADERLAVRELGEAFFQQFDQRRVLGDIDIGGHAGRILLEPDALHGVSPSGLPRFSGRDALFRAVLSNAAAHGKAPARYDALYSKEDGKGSAEGRPSCVARRSFDPSAGRRWSCSWVWPRASKRPWAWPASCRRRRRVFQQPSGRYRAWRRHA